MRRVNFLAGFELDFTDGQHVPGAVVKQPDNVRVQLVNCLTMFGKAHAGKA
jgi:hypothetical protein